MENILENEIKLENNLVNEKEQNNFLETTLGKTINTGIDIGIRALLPDYIEEQIIDLKDNLKYEKELYNKGYSLIAGVDEVGRGPLVGPVVAAAVILPKNYKLEGLTDSKKLSEAKRNYFDEIIKRDAISYGIGVIDNNIIDEVNIYEATKLAMKQAISNLKIKPDYVLTDAMKLDIDIDFKPLIKGDLRSLSISAASVIAKVYRDNLMYLLDKKYPF